MSALVESSRDNESDAIGSQVTLEDKLAALHAWWSRHCQSFSLWYLSLSGEKRRDALLAACPSIPSEPPAARFAREELLSATDIILPELNMEALSAAEGKSLLILFTRRCVSMDSTLDIDITLLENARQRGSLPSFSGGALAAMRFPFINLKGGLTDVTIQTIADDASPEVESLILSKIKSGECIHAEVYLALQIRREALADFMIAIADMHRLQMPAPEKPSPTFQALLAAVIAERTRL